MNQPLVPVHHYMVAVQSLAGDVVGVNNQRNSPGPRHDRRVRTHRALLEDDTLQLRAPVIEQLRRADVARNEDGVFRHLGTGVFALSCQNAQQPVRQIIQVMKPLAKVRIWHL